MQATSKSVIDRINTKPRNAKYLASWLGFLEGLMACSRVTPAELEPLKQKTEIFMKRFYGKEQDIYNDVKEIILDFPVAWENMSEVQSDNIEVFLSDQLKKLQIDEYRNEQNLLNGFLEGVATDGFITLKEAKIALKKMTQSKTLINEYPYNNLIKTLEGILNDNAITDEESTEICDHIARIVGESFSDIGLVDPDSTRARHDFESEFDVKKCEGLSFCLTGDFYHSTDGITRPITRPEVERCLEGYGLVRSGVNKSLNILFISDSVSKNYATETAGTKIIKARKINEKYGENKIKLVSERRMWNSISL